MSRREVSFRVVKQEGFGKGLGDVGGGGEDVGGRRSSQQGDEVTRIPVTQLARAVTGPALALRLPLTRRPTHERMGVHGMGASTRRSSRRAKI